MGASLLLRAIPAWLLGLGHDEVYYWTYAAHPALAHFDHPSMVGWMIQASTLNTTVNHEFLVRLPALLCGTLNIWLLYVLGRGLGTARAGWFAAVLYAASSYGSIISGLFILPDTPLVTFWLIALVFGINAINKPGPLLLGVGAACGLAMASKYQGVFLAVGCMAYALVHRRVWFSQAWMYVGIVAALALTVPTVYWHASNNFISFTHQGGVSVQGRSLAPDSLSFNINTLLTEIGGHILYTHPVVWVLIVMAMVALLRRSLPLSHAMKLILWTSAPVICTFLIISAFRSTLPHWAAPGYVGLMAIAGVWFDRQVPVGHRFPWTLRAATVITAGVLILGVGVVRCGWLLTPSSASKSQPLEEVGRNDVRLDMFGWDQVATRLKQLDASGVVVSTRWFSAAHLEYHIRRQKVPLEVRALGPMNMIHDYAFRSSPPFLPEQDVWYATTSRSFVNPEELHTWFERVDVVDTSAIVAGADTLGYAFIARMRSLRARN